MTTSPGPSLKYPGAKWGKGGVTARWIVGHLPAHTVYVEPFFGSGGVFFSKPPSKAEYINDLDGDVVNLFRVMRDQFDELCRVVELTPYSREEYDASFEPAACPLERARLTLVRHWMSVGGNQGAKYTSGWRHSGPKSARGKSCTFEWDRLPERIMAHAKRLKGAHIENRPALEVLGRLNHSTTLAYLDPPYLKAVRKQRMYREEMLEDAQHIELLTFLAQDWQGMAVLSGYPHPLYDELLPGWTQVTRDTPAEMGQARTEALWINPSATHRGLF